MRAFVVGATGFVGSAIARELLRRGHVVSGSARTAASAERLRAIGVDPVACDLDDGLDEALEAARAADVTVYAAQIAPEREEVVVARFLAALTGRTFVFHSGTGVFMQRTNGAWSEDVFAEDDPFAPEPLAVARVRTEVKVRESGVRGLVVRPPYLWGLGEHGHLAAIHRSVAVTGSACYVGDGLNCYSHLHVDDDAALVADVVERGTASALYHGVGGEVPNRWLAEAVASDTGTTARAVTMAEAAQIWDDFTALIMGASSRSRAPRSRNELGWRPVHTDLFTAIGAPELRAMAERPAS